MKTLIAYGSKYGCTDKCVKMLKDKLNGEVTVVNLEKEKVNDLNEFDKVIIGSPIYVGIIRKEVKEFIINYKDLLKEKKLGLFTCAMFEGDKAMDELKLNYSELFNEAIAKSHFGGELNFKRMRLLEKFITKMVCKSEKKVIDPKDTNSTVSVDKINEFAVTMNNA